MPAECDYEGCLNENYDKCSECGHGFCNIHLTTEDHQCTSGFSVPQIDFESNINIGNNSHSNSGSNYSRTYAQVCATTASSSSSSNGTRTSVNGKCKRDNKILVSLWLLLY